MFIVASAFALLLPSASAVNNGLARTPQMGWNNWNSLGCAASQDLLLDTSSTLISSGLRDVGYNYVVLDDCWSSERNSKGKLVADKEKFPKGMKWVAEKLHEQDLLFGMYSSAGELTCAGYPGSLDWEKEDADSFASWDVDYLKYDNCYHRGRFGFPEVSFNRYNNMAQALNNTGRKILYGLCTWGEDYVHTWGQSLANSWRISGDIYDSFDRPDDLCSCTDPKDPHCVAPGTHCSVVNIVNRVAPFVDRGAPGGWNDLDSLEVGHGGMSDEEYKAHFSLWAALKSPLVIGADLRHLSAETLTILNNPAIIAVNQDPLGRSAIRIRRNTTVAKDPDYGQGETQIWSGALYPHDQVVLFLNAANEDLEMATSLAEIFVHDGPGGSAPQVRQKWDLYDLWADRMDTPVAKKILGANAKALPKVIGKMDWYNSTAKPYAEGLKEGDQRLLGKLVGGVAPGGEVRVQVPRHAIRMFRLRNTEGSATRYQMYKQEL